LEEEGRRVAGRGNSWGGSIGRVRKGYGALREIPFGTIGATRQLRARGGKYDERGGRKKREGSGKREKKKSDEAAGNGGPIVFWGLWKDFWGLSPTRLAQRRSGAKGERKLAEGVRIEKESRAPMWRRPGIGEVVTQAAHKKKTRPNERHIPRR